MKIRLFFILTFLLISNFAFACVCSEKTNEAGATELENRSDIIVLASALEKVEYSASDQRPINIIFKVDSIIKGPTNLKRIVINQWSTGNCVKIFNLGEQYLITGLEIKEFIFKQSDQDTSSEKLIPPPPPNQIERSKMICYDYDVEEVEYWNELARNHLVVSTDQCRSFRANGEMAKYFRKRN